MRFFLMVLLCFGYVYNDAVAQNLPANPWGNGAVKTYAAPVENTAQNTPKPLPDVQTSNTSITQNLDTLMVHFINSLNIPQPTPQAESVPESEQKSQKETTPAPNNNDALIQFLQKVIASDTATKAETKSQSANENTSNPNPVAEAESAYNRFVSDIKQKINNTIQSARNSYNNAVNNTKNQMHNTRKNLFK